MRDDEKNSIVLRSAGALALAALLLAGCTFDFGPGAGGGSGATGSGGSVGKGGSAGSQAKGGSAGSAGKAGSGGASGSGGELGCPECEADARACPPRGQIEGCGPCLDGYIQNASGDCILLDTCSDLRCEDENRVCDEGPPARCEEDCVPGFVWDADLGACRVPFSCLDLGCADEATCVPETDSEDAKCGVGNCPKGFGWDVETGKCLGCAGMFSPSCNNASGETGKVLTRESRAGAECICETRTGYFVGLEGNAAVACDLDDDGWVNDNAEPALEGANKALRVNARCDVRRVQSIALHNEIGDAAHAEDMVGKFPGVPGATPSEDIPEGLPLYESARNDGAVSSTPPAPYGATALPPKALNSLTKACVSTSQDYNDNGIGDVGEWSARPLGPRASRNPTLAKYYREYLRFSHYLELYAGWYDAPAGDPAVYHVRERSRLNAANPLPVGYLSGADPSWRTCSRHTDADYVAPSPLSRAGGDFTEFASLWPGMLHSSQFKCVQVVSEADYDASGRTRASNPEIVYKLPADSPLVAADPALLALGGALARRNAGSSLINGCDNAAASGREVYNWTPNVCSAGGGTYQLPGMIPTNAAFPLIDCTPRTVSSIAAGVYWVAVGYESFACERDDRVTASLATYVRGCANACAELGVTACESYDPRTPPDSARFTCDDESRQGFGRLECGCGRSYAGTSCELSCPGDGLHLSADFSIESRQGLWQCGRLTASSGTLCNSASCDSGYKLLGLVPLGAANGATAAAGGYVLRAR